MSVTTVGEDVAAAVVEVRRLVDEARSAADCEVLQDWVVALAEAEKVRAKSRTRAVVQLEAAAIHLGRADVHVIRRLGCVLASAALDEAVELLRGPVEPETSGEPGRRPAAGAIEREGRA